MEIQLTADSCFYLLAALLAVDVVAIWRRLAVKVREIRVVSQDSISKTYKGSVFASAMGLIVVAAVLAVLRTFI